MTDETDKWDDQFQIYDEHTYELQSWRRKQDS